MQIVENYKDVSFRFAKMNTDNFILLYVHSSQILSDPDVNNHDTP